MLKLNLGSGPKKKEGFKSVDALDWGGVTDYILNLEKTPWYDFEDNSVDEIYSIEFLEHTSFRLTHNILSECYRILKPGCKIHLEVPDCGKAMEYYVNKQVCSCVSHKAKNKESFKADPDCFSCQGKGMINPTRWLFSFTGAQKHNLDFHNSIFTQEIMSDVLEQAGFKNIKFEDNIYKIVVNAFK